MAWEVVWNGTFGGRLEDRDHAIGVYLAHNRKVREIVPPERLLVFYPAEGLAPLCTFLGVPVPDEPFPRVNTTEDLQTRRQQLVEAQQQSGAL
jgi:hypothetical protein